MSSVKRLLYVYLVAKFPDSDCEIEQPNQANFSIIVKPQFIFLSLTINIRLSGRYVFHHRLLVYSFSEPALYVGQGQTVSYAAWNILLPLLLFSVDTAYSLFTGIEQCITFIVLLLLSYIKA